MKVSVISFTEQGSRLNIRLTKGLIASGRCCSGYVTDRLLTPFYEQSGLLPMKQTLGEWTGKQFQAVDGLVFIGAAGIAVRAIAPFVKDKWSDPAVVVVDEDGTFAISLLSGHVGGANDLALEISKLIGAAPVITTATDVRNTFAVDVFAKKQGLTLTDRDLAKRVSADLLEERPVGLFSDYPVEGVIPQGLIWQENCDRNLWITSRKPKDEGAGILRLVPRTLMLGIGCRRGMGTEMIRKKTEVVFRDAELSLDGIAAIASIDLKKEEPGLRIYAKELGVELDTFGADVLRQVPGDYIESDFVTEITGVGNVCERAAMAAAAVYGSGRLLVNKKAGDGVTVAVAERNWMITI